ncbi:MAG TPA: hypothetical protein VG269_02525 [Tepidisphaeraceae bacterium]|nr:hypothetical protein [Tepidisphaeraceae bacterium]
MVEAVVLEARVLFAGNPFPPQAPAPQAEGLPGIHVPAQADGSTTTSAPVAGGALHPLTDLPILHSDTGAAAEIYLDFTGAAAQAWGTYHTTTTPAYSTDADTATFSDTELANIQQMWARVAEKFSPFNIDVTTADPGQYTPGHVLRVVVGGDGLWQGANGWGGISFVGDFVTGPSTSWIFTSNLSNGDPHYTAEAIAHEAGHAFGLQHQSVYSGKKLTAQYNAGTTASAPIMGRSYFADRGLWWDGQNVLGYKVIQDDMSTIASPANGFGYRPLTQGQSMATAGALAASGSAVGAAGIIESTAQTDFYSFTSGAGTVNLAGLVAPYGAMLHMKMTLLDAAGNVLASAADAATLGQNISAQVAGGTYYLEVSSFGGYGDVGQYSIAGSVIPTTAVPPVTASAPGSTTPAPVAASPVTTGGVPVAASAPSVTLKASVVRKTLVGLKWAKLPKTVITFVERSTDGVNWTVLTKITNRATSFTDRHAPPGTYEYRLMSVGTGGVTTYSTTATATLPAPAPKKPAAAHALAVFSEQPITLTTAKMQEIAS